MQHSSQPANAKRLKLTVVDQIENRTTTGVRARVLCPPRNTYTRRFVWTIASSSTLGSTRENGDDLSCKYRTRACLTRETVRPSPRDRGGLAIAGEDRSVRSGGVDVRDRKNEKLYTEDIGEQPGSRLDAGVRAQARFTLYTTEQSDYSEQVSHSSLLDALRYRTVNVFRSAPHRTRI